MSKLEEAAKAYQEKEQEVRMQKLWEQSIQLDGLYTFDEAQKECPKGYRVPTFAEWAWLIDNTEYSFDRETREGVFRFADGFELRLPAAGYRDCDSGYLDVQGTEGYFWSSSPSDTYAWCMRFDGVSVDTHADYQADAFSVRCLPMDLTKKRNNQ